VSPKRRTALAVAAATACVLGLGATSIQPVAAQQVACSVTYEVTNQWPGGFGANVTINNLGAPINGWTLTWSFTAGQTVTQIWNGTVNQSGSQVTVQNAPYNASIPSGGSVSFGFNGTWNDNTNPAPTSFTLNGTVCNGQPGPTTTGPTTSPTTGPTTSPPPTNTLPSSFRWSSSGVLAGPRPDSAHRDVVAIKDYTVVRYNNQWQVYATTASPSAGWNLVHFAFSDWSQAASAPHTYLDTATPIGRGYRAAPHIFYFAPHDLWYMVYQTGLPSYSVSRDPSDPYSWSAPRNFMSSEPPIVTQNKGNGAWLDFWMICDDVNCYLFSSDDNGHIYRSQTTVANFPNGFGNTVIVLQDSNRFNLFEGTAVYRVGNSGQYLLLQEAIGSDGRRWYRWRRWYRSFTSNSLTGQWVPLAATESNPFARSNNVTFPSGTPAWTRDFSHGELIRASNDQTVPINPCRLQFLYQGMDPNASGEYITLPWRMGLLTQTNSPC